MKKHPHIHPLLDVAAAILCTLSLLLSMTACGGTGVSTATTSDEEIVTLPPLTVPDLTDDRTPTDTTPYADRLSSLFSDMTPAPASDFTYEITEGGVTVTGYTGGELVVLIPDTIEDKPVTAIAEKAFEGKGNLKAISVPDSVTSIGNGAFAGCKGLTSLRTPVYTCPDAPFFGALFGAASHEANGGSVPATLATLVLTAGETIPDYAFYACRGLEAVSLPAGLTEIGDFAFYACQALTYIPAAHTALTAVGDHAFTGCAALLSLELPATTRTMGKAMLEGCGKLESLTVSFPGGQADSPSADGSAEDAEQSTAYLGYLFGASDYTFTAGYIPASLMTVTVTAGCTAIPPNAFFECASIREIRLPDGVTSIGRRAFYGCERLTAVTLPDSVTTLGDDAFHGCIRMRSFAGGRSLTALGVQTFMDCVSLETVTLPATLTHLPNSCFSGCRSLENLTADGVTSQGKQVFRHCDKLQGWSN